MTTLYTCRHCGVVTEVATNLCQPQPLGSKADYCGIAPERGTLCSSMKKHLPFVCGQCGRPAEEAELVCDPLVLGS